MVLNGFSILEVRKLYLDEFYEYYRETYYNLEVMGKIKKGSYSKLTSRQKAPDPKDTVKKIKSQIFKGMNKKNKK